MRSCCLFATTHALSSTARPASFAPADIKAWQRVVGDLSTNDAHELTYKGHPVAAAAAGLITVASISAAKIA